MKKIILLFLLISSAVLGQNCYPKPGEGRNIFSINPVNTITDHVGSFAYERISKKGYIGTRIPVCFPLVKEKITYYLSGVELKIYPAGQGWIKGYLGASVIGKYQKLHARYTFNECMTGAVLFNAGLSYTPTEHLNVQIGEAIGQGSTLYDVDLYNRGDRHYLKLNIYYKIDVTVGIRF